MLAENLQDRDAPRIDDAVRVDLDVIFKARQHLGARRHIDRRGVPATHCRFELAAEARRARRVFGDARITPDLRGALEAVAAQEARVLCILAHITKARDVEAIRFAVFVHRRAARKLVEEAARADAAKVIHEIMAEHAR